MDNTLKSFRYNIAAYIDVISHLFINVIFYFDD